MKHTRLLSQMQVVITINLLLWLAMLFPALRGGTREERAITIAGVVFAAIAEHWSFYAVRKARRSDESGPGRLARTASGIEKVTAMAMTPRRADVIRAAAEAAIFLVIATTAGCLIAAGGLRGPLAFLTWSLAGFAAGLATTLLFHAGRRLYGRFKSGNRKP